MGNQMYQNTFPSLEIFQIPSQSTVICSQIHSRKKVSSKQSYKQTSRRVYQVKEQYRMIKQPKKLVFEKFSNQRNSKDDTIQAISLKQKSKNKKFSSFNLVPGINSDQTRLHSELKLSISTSKRQFMDQLLIQQRNSSQLTTQNIPLYMISAQIQGLQSFEFVSRSLNGIRVTNILLFTISKALLKHSSSMKIIKIDCNEYGNLISENGVRQLSLAIKKCHHLQDLHLDFSQNQLNDPAMKYICQALQDQKQLTSLALLANGYHNQITDATLLKLGEALNQKCMLKSLNLSFSAGMISITNFGMTSFTTCLQKLQELEILSLDFSKGFNCLTDEGLRALGASLVYLKKLKKLSINLSNGIHSFTDQGLKHFSYSVIQLSELQDINLDFRSDRNKMRINLDQVIKEKSSNIKVIVK